MTDPSEKPPITSHPFMIEMMSTHDDVLKLHPLLALLQEPGAEEDPILVIIRLLEQILRQLSRIESAVCKPSTRSPEPVEL